LQLINITCITLQMAHKVHAFVYALQYVYNLFFILIA
jgi:hypothetical protein